MTEALTTAEIEEVLKSHPALEAQGRKAHP